MRITTRCRQTFPILLLLCLPLLCVDSPSESKQSVTLAFAGDIMMGRQVGRAIQQSGDPSYPFRTIFPVFTSSDIAISNLECVLVDSIITGTYAHKIIRLPAYRDAVAGLKFAGFDGVSIANNHALDFSVEGVRSTISTLESSGIAPLGVSRDPVVIRKNGIRVAVFALMVRSDSLWTVDSRTGYFPVPSETLFAAIRQAKKRCECVVLFPHWGKDYDTAPTDWQKNLARRAVDCGADIVAGHGPHVIQEIEKRGRSVIAYSLGNCVFDQKYEETRTGLILKVRFNHSSGAVVDDILPIRTQPDTCQPEVLTNTDRDSILSRLNHY